MTLQPVPDHPDLSIDEDFIGHKYLAITLKNLEIVDADPHNMLEPFWAKAEAAGFEIVDDPEMVDPRNDGITAHFRLVETTMLAIPYTEENLPAIAEAQGKTLEEVQRVLAKASALEMDIVAVQNFIAYGTRKLVPAAQYVDMVLFETHYNLTNDPADPNGWRKTKVKRGEHVREHINW